MDRLAHVRTIVSVLALLLIGSALPATAGPKPAQTGAQAPSGVQAPTGMEAPGDKIRPELRQRLTVRGAGVPMWVRFADRADLSAAAAIDNWTRRGTAVAEALRRTADAAQRDVRRQLDEAGVEYRALWATNAIHVLRGSLALAERLAAEPEVQSLYPTVQYEAPKLDPRQQARAAAAVEWGIAAINADDVWSQYGTKGASITVANIDTGVQFDHPALVRQYRGNNGDGTFDHDYNWFDAAGVCAPAPCDWHGHGTHTMGTMAGSDGANQIGVAPDVKWIAANGCCPSDTALIESGQWMLEPTDLAGKNPDAGKRPHIINNSWGNVVPSTDPFMEDVTLAWAASGIFGMWSNGNLGPACDTSSSPGSRTANYSAGAFGASGAIAGFSSRGTGQDGEVKPNLAAPGVDVRSALPGNGYGAAEGTSMAAPHVAGAVALLWSAAPGLVGDVAATRELLDGTSVDAPDGSCGGTDDDNNVFGEGKLDALAVIDAAPVGATGTLDVSITDSRTRAPVGGATINVTGPVDRQRVTGADGTYALPLPVGDYRVTVSAFGYVTRTTNVTVGADRTTALRLGLTAIPRTEVSGVVRDASGHGWGMYAKITVADVPGGTFYTRPGDGRYELRLPQGASYRLTVQPLATGYQTITSDVVVGKHDVRRDLGIPIDANVCKAPGYGYHYDGAGTQFDAGQADGWTVADHLGTGHVWRLDDPFEVGNRTGGDGALAIGQSPGLSRQLDSSLVSPPIDLTGQSAPVIGFRQDFVTVVESADVDLSLDGGATWQTVFHQDRSARGPREEVLPVPQAANQSNVRVRFHYHVARFNSVWWQLDDVYVGARSCGPMAGSLAVGHVLDRNTGEVLNGVRVGLDGQAAVRTVATPDDPGLADGFYSLFLPAGPRQRLTARADYYQPDSEQLTVRADRVEQHDFQLAAGRLDVDPGDLTATARPDGTVTRTFTVTNRGSAPARVSFGEDLRVTGGSAGDQVRSGPGAEVVRIPGDFSPLAFAAGAGNGTAGHQQPRPPRNPWTDLAELPTLIMDNAVGEYGGLVYSVGGVDGADIVAAGYVYDPGTKAWSRIADLPGGRENASGAFLGDTFYVTGGWAPDVRASSRTFAYDRSADTWRPVADAPVAAAAAGRAVLDGKLYLVGGCTNACGMTDVRRYDPQSDSWATLAAYPESTGHLACAGLSGKLYCAGGTSRGTVSKNTYAYDPATDTWTAKADLPILLWGMGYTGSYDRLQVSGGVSAGVITNQGFEYDPVTDTWTELPASNHVLYRGGSACGLYRIGGSMSSGFFPTRSAELLPTYRACTPTDVEWLSVDRTSSTLAPGRSVRVTVRMNAAGLSPGSYPAEVWIKEDTPYLVRPVGLTLTVR